VRAHPTMVEGDPIPRTSSVRSLESLKPPPLVAQVALKSSAILKTQTGAVGLDAPPPPPLVINYAMTLPSALAGLGLAWSVVKAKEVLDTPSRTYIPGENTVGAEYDAWTEEEILEYYWGEHIHLGYYGDEDLKKGAGTLLGHGVKDFIEAKEDFVDEMYKWSGVEANNGGAKPMKILDVGCGIGGATRRLASKCVGGDSHVTGITLSQKQANRATSLAKAQGVPNAEFKVMDALNMTFPDDSFDMVWACESGEHMPDKKRYVEEMVRVLKPGGTLVIATWCQRHTPPALTKEEKSKLQFLYDEWAHPYFISIKDYCSLAEDTGAMAKVEMDDWTKQTIVSWRHSIWAGVYDPLPVFKRPKIYYKTLRDIICLERMQRAFAVGLMQYGMIKGVKK
jgi:MPBQ/MSBQ methyltransferase